MEEIIQSISVAPALLSWPVSFFTAIGIAILTGTILSLVCKFSYGGFALWGFNVGFLGLLFLWLVLIFLPLKWAIIVGLSIALPIYLLFYMDENSPVSTDELEHAAALRSPELAELMEADPAALDSLAKDLNVGIDQSSQDWAEGSVFRGIPRRVVRNMAMMLIAGYSGIVWLAFQFV